MPGKIQFRALEPSLKFGEEAEVLPFLKQLYDAPKEADDYQLLANYCCDVPERVESHARLYASWWESRKKVE